MVILYTAQGDYGEAVFRIVAMAIDAGVYITSIVKSGSKVYNFISSNYSDDVAKGISKYGDDFVSMTAEYGDDVISQAKVYFREMDDYVLSHPIKVDELKWVDNTIVGSSNFELQIDEFVKLGKLKVVKATNGEVLGWTSNSGLYYANNVSKDGNRVKHVLAHATLDPSKPVQTVFNVERNEILGLVDEAWMKKGNPLPNDAGAYLVDMGRVIGTKGETSIKIIVKPGTSEIITAYPKK